MNYKGFLVGFELEIKEPSYHKVAHNFPYELGEERHYLDDCWSVHYDGSVPHGAEIVSPINPPVEQIAGVVNYLKSIGGKVGKTCGFHIHISHPIRRIGIDLKGITVWNSRQEWVGMSCDNYYKYSYAHYVGKENHIEVRAFNGTLNLRYILCSLKRVINAVTFPDRNNRTPIKVICKSK